MKAWIIHSRVVPTWLFAICCGEFQRCVDFVLCRLGCPEESQKCRENCRAAYSKKVQASDNGYGNVSQQAIMTI